MHKHNFGFPAGNERLSSRSELEHALETTTTFGETSQCNSRNVYVARAFGSITSVPQHVSVVQPHYYLVPSGNARFYQTAYAGPQSRQTFMNPNPHHATSRMLQETNFCQHNPPFLVPSTFCPTQINYTQSLATQPTVNDVNNSTLSVQKANLSQHHQTVVASDILVFPQRDVRVSSTTSTAVVDNALIDLDLKDSESSYQSSMPVFPRRGTLVFQKDVHAPENDQFQSGYKRMVSLRHVLGSGPARKARSNRNAVKQPYSVPVGPASSRIKKTSVQNKYHLNLKSLMSKSDTQIFKTTSTSELDTQDTISTFKSVACRGKKAEHVNEEDERAALSLMSELLGEATDFRAAFASGEIRIEEQNVEIKSAPPFTKIKTTPDEPRVSSYSPSHSINNLTGTEQKTKEKTKPKDHEDKETVTLEEIFSMDMSETQALFDVSFQDVDLDSMLDSYLHHEEPSIDDYCLKEILESDEFAELFESTVKDKDTSMTSTTESSSSQDVESVGPVDKAKPGPKPHSPISIEDLFLPNKEGILALVADQKEHEQQVCESGSFEDDHVANTQDALQLAEKVDDSNFSRSIKDYIPDMLLFSATHPDVGLNVFDQTVTNLSGKEFIDEINTPPLCDDFLEQPTGHYDEVPFGHLAMLRADNTLYGEQIYRADGFHKVFHELKVPGNDIIVDPSTLETPRSPGRKRVRSHDSDDSPAKKYKVGAGSWITCSDFGNDADDCVTSKKAKHRYNNKERKQTGAREVGGNLLVTTERRWQG